ncbi:hypothetical protein [Chryseobacterium sp. c4a]|uniref:hypothetical protein n=1 Tax=Chryseobacterium sp. c4a TaxID=1573582 RepID=UPI00135AFB8E|nr:hypothetical protein [Chryseobacterium sp. c4a]
MGTFSKAFIKLNDLKVILDELKNYYIIGRQEIIEESKPLYYSQNSNETIILSNNYNNDWCEIELEFNYSVYLYDEFLRRLSSKFNTIILFAYYQSTIGDGRIAKFNRGQLDLSISQKYFKHNGHEKICLVDNFGISEVMKKEFDIPKLGEDFNRIDYDLINEFLSNNGLSPDNLKEYQKWSYLHIEKING